MHSKLYTHCINHIKHSQCADMCSSVTICVCSTVMLCDCTSSSAPRGLGPGLATLDTAMPSLHSVSVLPQLMLQKQGDATVFQK